MTAQRTRLRLESLDERALPSTVIYSSTSQMTGPHGGGSLTSTVTEQDDGNWSWNYHLTNESFEVLRGDGTNMGVGYFQFDLEDTSLIAGLGASEG